MTSQREENGPARHDWRYAPCMTWETGDVLALIFGVLGLVGGVVGFFRAVAASRQAAKADAAAQDARSDAAAALLRSADATERIAMAIEIISGRSSQPAAVEYRSETSSRAPVLGPELQPELRALIPAPEVRWAIEERSELDSYRLRNDGTIVAREVTVAAAPPEHSALVRMDADRPSLEPGSAVVVRTERRLSLSIKEIEIIWYDHRSSEPQRASLYLP